MSPRCFITLLCGIVVALAGSPLLASMQLGAQDAGATFLLLPIGARSVAGGEAAVADTLGAESAWWNPAALAAMKRSEMSLNGSQTFEGTSAAISVARPSRVLGTIGASATILDYGTQGLTDPITGGEIGRITIRSSVAMVSYATAIGSRLRFGLNYKYARQAFTCSGLCGDTPQLSGSSSALDIGAQYVVPTKLPITVAAAVRHIGPRFQVQDAEQADPLPRTWQVGASGRVPIPALDSAETTVDVMADLFKSTADISVGARLGAVVTYRGRYSLRGGYALDEGERGGPAIGVGAYLSDGMILDIARRFDSFSAQAGATPTYVSLRFLF